MGAKWAFSQFVPAFAGAGAAGADAASSASNLAINTALVPCELVGQTGVRSAKRVSFEVLNISCPFYGLLWLRTEVGKPRDCSSSLRAATVIEVYMTCVAEVRKQE